MNPVLARYGELLVVRWRWVLWGILFAMLFATVVTTVTPPVYRSDGTVFVRTPGDITRVQDGGDFYARARADTYAALAKGTGVSARVVADLGLDLTPDAHSRRVNADRRPDTALIDISVKGPSAAEAQRGVTVLIAELQSTVRTIEAVPGSVVPRAELVVVDPPSPAKRILAWGLPVAPVLFGVAFLGAVLGALGAVSRTMFSVPIDHGGDVAEPTVPVLATVPVSTADTDSGEDAMTANKDDADHPVEDADGDGVVAERAPVPDVTSVEDAAHTHRHRQPLRGAKAGRADGGDADDAAGG